MKRASVIALVGIFVLSLARADDQAANTLDAEPSSTASLRSADVKNMSRIVFGSNRSGAWRIWTIRPDGTGLTQLVEGGDPNEHDVDPRYSPDGQRLLFTSTRGGSVGIWIVSAAGTGPRRVCDGDQAEWSPDGKRVTFRKANAIWIRDLATGASTQVVPARFALCSGPSWSPDGKKIAFACRRDAGNAIFVVDAEGGNPVKVYDKKGACEPHWSPDGTTLVYETETHICTIQPDGTKNRLITYYGGVQRYAQWSSDGTRLVYCQGVTENGPWELYIVPSHGGQPIRVTEGGSDSNPDWQ